MTFLNLAKRLTRGRATTPRPEPQPEGEGEHGANALLSRYLSEARRAGGYFWNVRPATFEAGRAILDAPPEVQVAVIHAALAALVVDLETKNHVLYTHQDRHALDGLLGHLLRRRQPLSAEDVHRLFRVLTTNDRASSGYCFPLAHFVRAVERWVADHELTPEIRAGLTHVRAVAAGRLQSTQDRKPLATIDAILGVSMPLSEVVDRADDWGRLAGAALEELDPDARGPWLGLLSHAATAASAKPTKPWLKAAREAVAAVGEERCQALLIAWLRLLHQRPVDQGRDPTTQPVRLHGNGNPIPSTVLTERNGSLVKGLVWCCTLFPNPAITHVLADAAEAGFKKVPGIGPRSAKVGNACIHALGLMPGTLGAMQLQRLRQRVSLASARSTIDATLERVAQREGMTREDLDDLAVPTYDLDDGRRRVACGEFTAEIVVDGPNQVALRWLAADGAVRQSEPAAVKRDAPAAVKTLKQTVKDIEKVLAAQRDRIERLPMTERSWTLPPWRERYLDHPFLSTLARRLIWSFQVGDRLELGIWHNGRIVGSDDLPLDDLGDDTRVRLWHPVDSGQETVLAWQLWLERHEVSQPFKQAHREVYVLTDAERATATYSNRFAAHILRQHQFNALCQQRGWEYRLQGAFDGANAPTLTLPAWNLSAEFFVDGVEEGEDSLSTSYISLYAATDQVRFTRGRYGEIVPLTDIPPLVFSEVLRDVDLFVGVCSVGNDPLWQDNGPERHRVYWRDYAFGDLSASAETRRAVLARLLPRLKIAPRCSLSDKFLVVRGDLRTYKIHLGSGNIMMEPNNQYLCIVPGRGAGARLGSDRVFLPFEGDTQLSVILSKAFLLADDTAITDPTITRQIKP